MEREVILGCSIDIEMRMSVYHDHDFDPCHIVLIRNILPYEAFGPLPSATSIITYSAILDGPMVDLD